MSLERVNTPKASWRASQSAEVSRRANGRCEVCGARNVPLEWSHTFGRRNVIAEPLASTPEATLGACVDCHREATLNPAGARARTMQLASLARLEARWHILLPTDDPMGSARLLEDVLKADGRFAELCREAGMPER